MRRGEPLQKKWFAGLSIWLAPDGVITLPGAYISENGQWKKIFIKDIVKIGNMPDRSWFWGGFPCRIIQRM